MSNITATNRMSCAQLMRTQNAELQIVENPKTGKLFFVCGLIKGYISPAVLGKIDSVTVEELQFAEVSIDGNPAVPCLMMVGDGSKNVKRTLSL
jgi:hypothetical protein